MHLLVEVTWNPRLCSRYLTLYVKCEEVIVTHFTGPICAFLRNVESCCSWCSSYRFHLSLLCRVCTLFLLSPPLVEPCCDHSMDHEIMHMSSDSFSEITQIKNLKNSIIPISHLSLQKYLVSISAQITLRIVHFYILIFLIYLEPP